MRPEAERRQTQDAPDERGFARAIRPEDANEFARRDLRVYGTQDFVAAKADTGIGDGKRGGQWVSANAFSTPFNSETIQST